MNIALDYDGTYTLDPKAWDSFVGLMQKHGHNVYVVTMRHHHEKDEALTSLAKIVNAIYFTSRQAKAKYMEDIGIKINIWIDDNPWWIFTDST